MFPRTSSFHESLQSALEVATESVGSFKCKLKPLHLQMFPPLQPKSSVVGNSRKMSYITEEHDEGA
jgi:hypothetical protein